MANAFSFNGKRADIFINYTTQPVIVEVSIALGEKVYLSSEDFENKKSTVRDGEQITLAPLSVILIENDV
ncbi:MAG: hypothetical protein IJV83_03765 [Clostridia bacterium]|nr:hypothetical protein [Clostridia bacterium]